MKILICLCVSVCALVYAEDKDTIPLNKRTTPSASEEAFKDPAKEMERVQKNREAALPQPYIAGVDTFGSSRINETILKQFLGKELDTWMEKGISGAPDSPALEEKIEKKVQQKFGFEMAKWTVMQMFEPSNLAVYLTLDVVEKEDKATRMPFLPNPSSDQKDPENLVKNWLEYEEKGLDLIESGALEPDSGKCSAFHCPFGHNHIQLKKYEAIFADGVMRNEKALTDVLNKDRRENYRASAAFLLAYLKDGKKVISLMMDRLRDPSDHVRNNVLRVLGDIAEFHPEFPISAKPIIEVLNYPRVSDRAKASYVIHMLALNSQAARDEIKKSGIPHLIRLLSMKQPDGRDLAHATLRKVGGKELAATDIPGWTAWYNKLAKDRVPTNKKQ